MFNPENKIWKSLKEELRLLLIVSAGVFLFILFFQPFPLEMLDYDNRLLFVTGFGGITFLLAGIIMIVLPELIPKWFKKYESESNLSFILSFFFLIISTTAYAFYIRYVGLVFLTYYIMFKVVLVCLLPVIISLIYYKVKIQDRLIMILQDQNKYYLSKLKEFEKSEDDEEVEIHSTNISEKLILKYKNIVSVKSADNYIEISYLENKQVEKKLIRNTLKSIEAQLTNKRNFIRCHRTGIVNTMYIERLVGSYSGYSLKMNCFEDKIPVSRQYLMQVKEAILVN